MKTRIVKFLKGNKYFDPIFEDYVWYNGRFFVEDDDLKAEIFEMYMFAPTILTFYGDEEFHVEPPSDLLSLDRRLLKEMSVLLDLSEKIFLDPEIYNKEREEFYEDKLIEFVHHYPECEEDIKKYMNLIDQGKIQDSIDFSL